MSHKENQAENFGRATKGLPHDYQNKVHRNLAKYYPDTKDQMDFDALLDVVTEVMSDYPEWRWDGSQWKS